MIGPEHAPLAFRAGTDFVGPAERIAHIVELEPEIGSLDCGSLNFDEMLYGTTPGYLRTMAGAYLRAGVRPELEVFELGHIELAKQLIGEGLIAQPGAVSAVPRHQVWRPCFRRGDASAARCAACRVPVVGVRPRPHANADGRAERAARRKRARRTRG